MSSRHYYKLDNELARANELVTIGQLDKAVDHLLKVITTIGYHSSMTGFDALFERFLELAVQLRRGKAVKDGLFAYRNLYQNQNVLLVEAVLLTFLDILDAEMSKVLKEVPGSPTMTVNDDLDTVDYSPEALLAQAYGVSLFSDADEHDRKYRELVLPVLRFAWEGYRNVLDCARNNNRLEMVYEKAGHRSILFCTKHRRPAEFRRLCELFRYHLHVAVKYPGQASSISLDIPESQQRQLNLRFACLEAASDFGLWQEAFRVIEDIHSVFSASHRRTHFNANVVLSPPCPNLCCLPSRQQPIIPCCHLASNLSICPCKQGRPIDACFDGHPVYLSHPCASPTRQFIDTRGTLFKAGSLVLLHRFTSSTSKTQFVA